MSIGERVVERYVKHPAAATGWLADGDPLDAGTAHLVHSNLSHLSERNVRLVAHTPGPGAITGDTTTNGWAGLVYDTQDTGATDDYALIPWNRAANAFVCGPVALSHTRIGTSPAGLYPRKVRVVIQGTKSSAASTTLWTYAVLTGAQDTPLRATRYAQATESKPNGGAAATYIFSLTLSCEYPVRPSELWRCRASGASEGSGASITPAWVWVGWRSNTTGISPDTIESVSVFEVWE
jgi:hypothetical protein